QVSCHRGARKMKKLVLFLLLTVAVVTLPGLAWAHGWPVRVWGPWWPVPWLYPYRYYYPPPVYYYPPPVYPYPSPTYSYLPAPVVQPVPPPAVQYWYWCSRPQGYYPYIQQCLSGWQPVSPQGGSPP